MDTFERSASPSLLLTEINIFLSGSLDIREVELTVQEQGLFSNDFWAAPDWVLNVCNIHKQLYTVQLGRQRCTGLSDRFAWLSTWDPEDDEGDGSPARERTCTMDDFHYCITALHTHSSNYCWINWSGYLSLPSTSVFLPSAATPRPTAFIPPALQLLSRVYSRSSS